MLLSSPDISVDPFQHLQQVDSKDSARKKREPVKYSNEWDRYQPVQRSAWWLQEIKGYPDVGTYNPQHLPRLPNYPSSAFKSTGRLRPSAYIASGKDLLPGAYNYSDFTSLLAKDLKTYSFKDSIKPREDILTEGLVDPHLKHLTPGQYNVEHYQSIKADKEPVKGSCFKSKSRRVIAQFQPKEGPAPGAYKTPESTLSSHGHSASFQSRAPRFTSSYSKMPAPGTYGTSYQSPMPANMMKMGRQHGLFFSAAFYP